MGPYALDDEEESISGYADEVNDILNKIGSQSLKDRVRAEVLRDFLGLDPGEYGDEFAQAIIHATLFPDPDLPPLEPIPTGTKCNLNIWRDANGNIINVVKVK